MTRACDSERGAALLVVMVAVAVLTALAVNLAYDSRVSLQIAGNSRDELRATALAKSGIAFSRLVLKLQQDIDDAGSSLPSQVSVPRPQVWRHVPIASQLADALFGGPGAGAFPPASLESGARAAPPDGGFEVELGDEGTKVNFQLEASSSGLLAAQVQAVYQLICDPKWDALFDREDANGLRVPRQDLLVYLRDWVFDSPDSSALAASFPAPCVMVTQNPFERGFQDKNYPYDRGEDRYRAKNARMDSLAELYMVAGIGDAFMAAFGDAITVYLPRDAKRNVNDKDPARLLENAKSMAVSQDDPRLSDPTFPAQLQKLFVERTYDGLLTVSPSDFGQLVDLAGVKVNQNLLQTGGPQNYFTDRSTVFRIQSAGRAGDVKKTLDVVMRFDKAQGTQAALPVPIPGQIVHWREE